MRDMYAQQKAKEDLDALMQSDAPNAGIKAFAKGMAAGAGAAFIPTAVAPWAARSGETISSLKSRAYLAHLLQERIGLSKKDAATAAEGAVRYLNDVNTLPDGLRNVLQQTLTVETPDVGALRQAKMPEASIRHLMSQPLEDQIGVLARKTGLPEAAVRQNFFKRRGVELPSSKVTAATRRAILGAAEESYRAAGKKAPSLALPLAEDFGKALRRGLPFAAPISLVGGFAALRKSRKDRQKARALKRKAGIRS